MRALKIGSFLLAGLLLAGVTAAWFLLRAEWVGQKLGQHALALAQAHLAARLEVEAIRGNLWDGLSFQKISLRTPKEEIFRAESLQIRLSLWSLLELRPVAEAVLKEPRLIWVQDQKGGFKTKFSSSAPPGKRTSLGLPLAIKAVNFRQFLITAGEVEIRQPTRTLTFRDLEGEAAFTLENPFSPHPRLNLAHFKATSWGPWGRWLLNTRLSLAERDLKLEFLEVRCGKHSYLTLRGEADLRENGPIRATGRLFVAAWDLSQNLTSVPGLGDVRVQLGIKGVFPHLSMELTGRILDQEVSAAGSLKRSQDLWQWDFQGELPDFSPGLLLPPATALAEKIRDLKPLSVRWRLRGTGFSWPPPRFSLDLESGPWQWQDLRGGSANFSLTGDGRDLALKAAIAGEAGSLRLTARGPLWQAPRGVFSGTVENLRPEKLGLKLPPGTLLSGKGEGTFQAASWEAARDMEVAAGFDLSGRLGPHPLALQGAFRRDKNRLELRQSEGRWGNMAFAVRGMITGGQWDLRFKGALGPKGGWPLPPLLAGELSWEGFLKGTLANPEFQLTAKGKGLGYQSLKLSSGELQAHLLGWPPLKGQLTLRGNGLQTPAAGFEQLYFTAQGDKHLWSWLAKAEGPKGGKLDLDGATHFGQRWLKVAHLAWQKGPLKIRSQEPLFISWDRGLEIRPATLSVNQGKLQLQGEIFRGKVSGRLELRQLEAAWLARPGLPLHGTLNGFLVLEGQAREPVFHGLLELREGWLQDLKFSSGKLTFAFQQERLSVAGSLATHNGGPVFSFEGFLPLRLTLWPFSAAMVEDGLRLSLKGEDLNLSWVSEVVPQVESAQGKANLQALLWGSLPRPQITGRVSWGEGRIKLRAAGALYHLQAGEIRLQGNRISIPELTLVSDGTAVIKGELTLAGLKPAEVQAQAILRDFKAFDKLGSVVHLSGMANLSGSWPKLTLEGNLEVPKASLRLSFLNLGPAMVNPDVVLVRPKPPSPQKVSPWGFLEETEVWKNLKIQLALAAPRNFWVDDRNAKIEGRLSMVMRKAPGQELNLAGNVEALKGGVLIMGREFQVVKGNVSLPPKLGMEPRMDLNLEYDAGEVTLFADLSGPLSNPRITLRGDPPVSEAEWMSYLLYGKPIAALSREEQGAALAARAVGGVATKLILQDLLGLTPPLARGLTITYQQRTDPLYRDNPHQVVIQYRLNRRFSVQSQVGGRNTGGDVLFNLDF